MNLVPDPHGELRVRLGDCEFMGYCKCGRYLGTITPDKSFDDLGQLWERHYYGEQVSGETAP